MMKTTEPLSRELSRNFSIKIIPELYEVYQITLKKSTLPALSDGCSSGATVLDTIYIDWEMKGSSTI